MMGSLEGKCICRHRVMMVGKRRANVLSIHQLSIRRRSDNVSNHFPVVTKEQRTECMILYDSDGDAC